MEEQVGATTILFTGGLDTTKAALGNIVAHLAEQPGLEARLRDPDWLKDDLDEFLRATSRRSCSWPAPSPATPSSTAAR